MKKFYKLIMSLLLAVGILVIQSTTAIFATGNILTVLAEEDSTDTATETEGKIPVGAKATVTEHNTDTAEGGKEFYTIQTKNENTFYLIIDHGKIGNNVYFLTEVSENDLLSVTDAGNKVITQNSSVVESVLPNMNGAVEDTKQNTEEVKLAAITPENASNMSLYIMMGIAIVVAGGAYYYIKFVKGKKGSFDDDEFDEEEDEENEEYEKDTKEIEESEEEGEYMDNSSNEVEADYEDEMI